MNPTEVLELMDKLGSCSVRALERLARRLRALADTAAADAEHADAIKRLIVHVEDELDERHRGTSQAKA